MKFAKEIVLILILCCPDTLCSESISIQFSQDFIATITQRPWSTMHQIYPKPSYVTIEKHAPNSLEPVADTLDRLTLGMAGYALVTRLWQLHKNILIINATRSPLGHFKKIWFYAGFFVDVSALSFCVLLMRWCTKNLLRSSSYASRRIR